jgi:hypothetical protein
MHIVGALEGFSLFNKDRILLSLQGTSNVVCSAIPCYTLPLLHSVRAFIAIHLQHLPYIVITITDP